MKFTTYALTLSLAAVALLGCGDAGPTTAPSDNSTTQNSAAPPPAGETDPSGFVAQRPAQPYDDPRQAVHDFLTSVKAGDDSQATALLSTAAQEEAWKNGLAISADGFPDAKFEVSDVEYLDDNKEAHVMSVWSDVTPDGEPKSFRCVWLLAREPHGWCVYGMATKFLEFMDPVILNFEDQADMAKKQRWAEEQIVKHQQSQQPSTEGPEVQQATHTTNEQQLR